MDQLRCIGTANRHLVFFYGTLKSSQANHHHLLNHALGHARFLSTARTKQRFPLSIYTRWNIPFLLDDPGKGEQIYGEIYEVDDQRMEWLDKFEEHPEIYTRDTLTCEIVSKDVIVAVRNDAMDDVQNSHGSSDVRADGLPYITSDDRSSGVSAEVPKDPCIQNGQVLICWTYFLKDFPPDMSDLEMYSCYDGNGSHNKPYLLKNFKSCEDTYGCLAGRKRTPQTSVIRDVPI